MKKDTRYIYNVKYGIKSPSENYEVIKSVDYYRWDNEQEEFLKRQWDTSSFAKGLINNEYKARACKDCGEKLTNCQDVIGYKQKNDGECWIKTRPDDTTENNLEFLNYCKQIGIAQKE